MASRPRFASIDDYVAAAAPEVRDLLQALRAAVAQAVPDATECIAYQMPAWRRGKVFLYVAAFKKHVGVYPPAHHPDLSAELNRYRGPKGNLQLPLSEPVPVALVARVAVALARQYGEDSGA